MDVEANFRVRRSPSGLIRLVTLENIHHARYLAASPAIRDLNITAIDTLAAILKRGRKLGVFRDALIRSMSIC